MRKIASVWGENFDEYRLDLEKVIDVGGDRVAALVYQRGRIKRSSDWMEQRIGYDWEVRDGRGIRVQVYFSWEEALEAVGLSE
jgi:ketosteroid isomerase-like protein